MIDSVAVKQFVWLCETIASRVNSTEWFPLFAIEPVLLNELQATSAELGIKEVILEIEQLETPRPRPPLREVQSGGVKLYFPHDPEALWLRQVWTRTVRNDGNGDPQCYFDKADPEAMERRANEICACLKDWAAFVQSPRFDAKAISARPYVGGESAEARDAWIYDQCLDAGTSFAEVRRRLDKQIERQPKKGRWMPIGTDNGIKNAANKHAKYRGKANLPPRQSGSKTRS